MKKETSDFLVKLIWYFIIFSILGLLVETSFGFLTMGILESRKGFVFGPLCPIYGFGAVAIIVALDKFKDSKWKIFFYGMIAGAAVEYFVSFALEAIYGTRFWDYSYLKYNLNGRICLQFSSYWGFLSLAMIYLVKPRIDKLIDKIPKKNIIAKIAFVLLVIDAILTVIAIYTYQQRAQTKLKNEIPKEETILTEEIFTNEFMKKNFPNIRIQTEDGNLIFIRDIL